jgi:hypothetical protein
MKFLFAILLSLILWIRASSQTKQYPFYQLYQLDSIGKSPSICRHFGKLYFNFLQLVEEQLQHEDTTNQRLIRNFEKVFAQFYIDACTAYKNHVPIFLPAWKTYFTDTTLESYQYNLLGANAHLNGGLAEAIAGSYTPEEWKRIKKKYTLFNSCLNKTYRLVYTETMSMNKQARKLHALTLGLDKTLGYYYLYKWRKRAMRLMKYYFAGSPVYKKLQNKISRKKEKIDKLVFTQL